MTERDTCLMCGEALVAPAAGPALRRPADVPDFCAACLREMSPEPHEPASPATAVAAMTVRALGALGRSLVRTHPGGTARREA